MEARAGKANQQKFAIGSAELTSMVSELMTAFERTQADEWVEHEQLTSDWISPSTLTRVIRHGSSASCTVFSIRLRMPYPQNSK